MVYSVKQLSATIIFNLKFYFMSNETLEAHHETAHDHKELNWLDSHELAIKWRQVRFKIDERRKPSDIEKMIERNRKMIEALLRGWLEIYNKEHNRNHKLIRCQIRKNDNSDFEYTVKAFIDPPQEPSAEHDRPVHIGNGHNGGTGGNHLVPAPPPPPDEVFG